MSVVLTNGSDMLFLAADDLSSLSGLNKSNADRTGDASSIAFSILIIKLFTNDLQTMGRKCKMLFSMSPSFKISTALFVCLASNIASAENSRGLLAWLKYFNYVSANMHGFPILHQFLLESFEFRHDQSKVQISSLQKLTKIS